MKQNKSKKLLVVYHQEFFVFPRENKKLRLMIFNQQILKVSFINYFILTSFLKIDFARVSKFSLNRLK